MPDATSCLVATKVALTGVKRELARGRGDRALLLVKVMMPAVRQISLKRGKLSADLRELEREYQDQLQSLLETDDFALRLRPGYVHGCAQLYQTMEQLCESLDHGASREQLLEIVDQALETLSKMMEPMRHHRVRVFIGTAFFVAFWVTIALAIFHWR